MKIARYKYQGEISYGRVEKDKIRKMGGDIFTDYYLTDRTIELKKVKLLTPVFPPNIIAIGINYKQHADEIGHESLPERPVIFLKSTTSITGPGDNIILPAMAPDEVDYEAELALIISKKAKNIEVDEVDDYIFGYTCANDISARDCQQRYDRQWARSKSFDTFCPLGPWVETELNPDNLKIKSILNGRIMQDSNTSDMIFKARELVSYCSKNMTLLPGTVILTGTPEGVGFGWEPKVFLSSGDKIEIEIENIGKLSNTVVSESENSDHKGSQVIKAWTEICGTVQFTPTMLDKIKSYINDGMQEKLIIEVIETGVKKAEGNPFNYIISILNDLMNRGILTLDDYQKELDRGGNNGGQIQKNTGQKKRRTQKQEIKELYKKGYR